MNRLLVGYADPDEYRPGKVGKSFTAPGETFIVVNGVGYQVTVVGRAAERIGRLSPTNDRHHWYVYIARSEYSETWYAMGERVDLDVFELLTSVKGVGPATAAKAIHANVDSRELLRLIGAQDHKQIKRRVAGSGFGPRAAVDICADEFAEKARALLIFAGVAEMPRRHSNSLSDHVEAALHSLGYTALQVRAYVSEVDWTTAYDEYDESERDTAQNRALRDALQVLGGR